MWYVIYNFLLGILALPAGIFVFLRNFRRSVKEYKVFFWRIFGKVKLKEKIRGGKRILVWCASVGEVRSIENFLKYFTEQEVVVTTGTRTGYQLASNLFSAHSQVSVVYSPLDFPWAVSRFLRIVEADLILIVETEIWPNFLWAARRRNIPLILVNGRFSRRSRQLFSLFAPLMEQLLNLFSLLLLRSENDRNNLNFLKNLTVLGEVTGNMKYDLTGKIEPVLAMRQRQQLFPEEFNRVIVAGSIRSGEEKIIISAVAQVRKQTFQKLKLLLAPRHLEIIPEIEKCLEENKFSFNHWSRIERQKPETADCLIVDTVGELFQLYGLADLAIIGGSFLDYGGQNPLEPAAWGCPVIFGKYMDNFAEEAGHLLQEGGALVAEVFPRLVEVLLLLLNDDEKRKTIGENARKVQQKFSGASERNFWRIKKFLQ